MIVRNHDCTWCKMLGPSFVFLFFFQQMWGEIGGTRQTRRPVLVVTECGAAVLLVYYSLHRYCCDTATATAVVLIHRCYHVLRY